MGFYFHINALPKLWQIIGKCLRNRTEVEATSMTKFVSIIFVRSAYLVVGYILWKIHTN